MIMADKWLHVWAALNVHTKTFHAGETKEEWCSWCVRQPVSYTLFWAPLLNIIIIVSLHSCSGKATCPSWWHHAGCLSTAVIYASTHALIWHSRISGLHLLFHLLTWWNCAIFCFDTQGSQIMFPADFADPLTFLLAPSDSWLYSDRIRHWGDKHGLGAAVWEDITGRASLFGAQTLPE